MLSGQLYKDYVPPAAMAAGPPRAADPPAQDGTSQVLRNSAEASAPEPEGSRPRFAPGSAEDFAVEEEGPRFVPTKPEVPPEAEELQMQDLPEGEFGLIHDAALNSVDGVGERRVKPIVKANIDLPVRRARMVLRKAALAYCDTMMERELLKEVIEEDRNRWDGCITLPVSVVFFITYLLAVVFHQAVTYTHITTTLPRATLQAGLVNVLTPDDVYTFLQDTYLPFFFTQYDGLGHLLPRERWSVIGQYSHFVGSARMELQRSAREPCQEMAEHVECYPISQFTGETFGKNLSSLPPPVVSARGSPWSLPGSWTWWSGATNTGSASQPAGSILHCADEGFEPNGCGGSSRRLGDLRYEIAELMPRASTSEPKYTFNLDSHTPYGVLYNRIEYLKARGWLDAQSMQLTLKAVMINNQLGGTPRIVSVVVYFYFSRGGGVFTDLKVEGMALNSYSDRMSYLADGLFVLLLAMRTIYLVSIIVKAAQRRSLQPMLNATFLFAFLTVGFSYLNILFLRLQEWMMVSVKQDLEAYFSDPSAAASSEALYASVSNVYYLSGYARPLVAYANFFFLCQVIIALQWQPRLAVVTQTLLACGSDLFHYLIVLTLTIAAFAISGMVIFGRRVIDFADPVAAIAVCFKISIEMEYDWQSLSDKEWMTSFCWVVLYLLLVVMLMVNMVLAIIMDVYAEVRIHSGDSMTIAEHLEYIYRKLKYRRYWVNDSDLYDQVCEMPQCVTLLEVREAFPEMHYYQLEYLQVHCQNKSQEILRVGLNSTYVSMFIGAISLGLEEVEATLERLKMQGWMAKGVMAGSDVAREWVKDIFGSIAVQRLWMSQAAKHVSSLQLRVKGLTEQDVVAQMKESRVKASRTVRPSQFFATNGASLSSRV